MRLFNNTAFLLYNLEIAIEMWNKKRFEKKKDKAFRKAMIYGFPNATQHTVIEQHAIDKKIYILTDMTREEFREWENTKRRFANDFEKSVASLRERLQSKKDSNEKDV